MCKIARTPGRKYWLFPMRFPPSRAAVCRDRLLHAKPRHPWERTWSPRNFTHKGGLERWERDADDDPTMVCLEDGFSRVGLAQALREGELGEDQEVGKEEHRKGNV